MAKRANKTGRTEGAPRFIQIPFWVLETTAALALSPPAFKVLVYVLKRHNGVNNGRIAFGARSGCFIKKSGTGETIDTPFLSKSQIAIALLELQQAGFIACEAESQFKRDTDFKEGQRIVREWRLTWLPCDGAPATKDFATTTGSFRPRRARQKNNSSVRQAGQLEALQSGRPDSYPSKNAQNPAYSPADRTAIAAHSPADRTHLITIPGDSHASSPASLTAVPKVAGQR